MYVTFSSPVNYFPYICALDITLFAHTHAHYSSNLDPLLQKYIQQKTNLQSWGVKYMAHVPKPAYQRVQSTLVFLYLNNMNK